MTEKINSGNSDIEHKADYQKRLFHMVNSTARILLAAIEGETIETSIQESMRIIADCFDFDRGYIW